MKILVVEDDAARILQFRLWLRGHDLALATTARRAIAILRRRAFDVVFLDHDLGGRTFVPEADPNTGAEVARYLVRRGLRIRVVIHSHNDQAIGYLRALLPEAEVIPFGGELAERLSTIVPLPPPSP